MSEESTLRGGFEPTAWPTLPLPNSADGWRALEGRFGSREEFAEWLLKREELIRCERENPLAYGWEGDHWMKVRRLLGWCRDLLILGGNRSGKTELAGKLSVERAIGGERRELQCWCQNETASIDRQQTYVHRYLPPELRGVKKQGSLTKVSYTRATGFSERVCVFPNGSVVRFMTYQGFRNDPTVAEGGELDWCWCDEMAPAELVRTLRFRLVSRGGTILQTFAPLEGYSDVVKEYLDGAIVEESMPAELAQEAQLPGCRRGNVPVLLKCRVRGRCAVLFWTQWNPYPAGSYENLKREVGQLPLTERLVRAYGWPTRMVAHAFPGWDPKVHVIERRAVPAEGTNYLVVDPAAARNWFMVWLRADDLGRIYVYREWPGVDVGEWAEPSEKEDGKAGPGQRVGAGRGVAGYRRLIRELECGADKQGERIEARLIDPRAGSAQVPGIDEGTSLVELLAQASGNDDEGMLFEPAPGCAIDEGVSLIANWLAFDREKPVDATNAPRLYVSDECQNVIYALSTWTGLDGEKGASKDPVDCLRYAAKRGVEFVDDDRPLSVAGRAY
jgi:hypothetical protein